MKHRFMKNRAAAILAALSVVATGALVATPAARPAPATVAASAGVPARSAAVQTVVDLPSHGGRSAPPVGGRVTDLDATSPASKHPQIGDGALTTVIAAIEADRTIPGALDSQVHVRNQRLRVEVTHTETSAAVDSVVAAGGVNVSSVTDTLLVADIPVDAIADLEATPVVSSVSLPSPTVSAPDSTDATPLTVGTLGGDIYNKTRIEQWHKIGLNGAGVSVGIVDYFNKAAWDDARTEGEIPSPAGTFCRSNGTTCNVFAMPKPTGLHGVAVAEAVHDMAPKAKLYLATVSSNADLKAAIDYFAKNGVRILTRSLGGFFDGPGDGTGPSADLVSYAVGKGIAWFNSAGNSGSFIQTFSDDSKLWVGGYWRQTFTDTDADGWHEFQLKDVDQETGEVTSTFTSETMYINCSPYFRLRWNDWGSSDPTDYDIYRVVDGEVQAPGYPPNYQLKAGDRPLELQAGSDGYFDCTPGEWIQVAIYQDRVGNGSDDILEIQGNSGDIAEGSSSAYSAAAAFNDSRSPGMAAVGAVDPVDGALIAGYSSHGPTNDGRVKPEISAGSNFTSRAYYASGGGGRFNGTSAATPVVAGAAAVALQRYGTRTPAQLMDYLRSTHTTDRGATGVDNVYGTGELIAKSIPIAAFSSTSSPKISGTRAVGSTLTAVKPAWKPSASFSYRWFRGTAPIAGATKATYKLTTADAGKKIRVRVIGSRGGYTTVTKYSSYTAPIAKLFTKAPTPKISGTAKVGRTLTATVGTWSPKPSKFTYQWKANGKAIKGATKKTYTITSSRVGARITVTVTASKSGYKSTAKTSAKTAKVTR